jgi:hypothetical protein
MTVDAIFIGLQRRNVRLNKPATIKELSSFESKLAIQLHPFFSNLLSKFNGFVSAEYDQKSQICIWNIDDILSHSAMMLEENGERNFVIGDILIYSDFIACSLENDSTPVFFREEKRQLATNIYEFFDLLFQGAFDFM